MVRKANPGNACKQSTGNNSNADNTIYTRTVINTPENEKRLRGIPVSVPADELPDLNERFGIIPIRNLKRSGLLVVV